MTETRFLDLPDGRLAYDDTGAGPLVVCIPAMLDLRSEYRFLTPLLTAAGLRVVTFDPRGIGESTATWPAYGSTPTAHDLLALIRHLDAGPALVVGTSMGAAAAVYAAAEAPELVTGIVLMGPFVRDPAPTLTSRLTPLLAAIPGVVRPLWLSYFPKMLAGDKPADLAEHLAAVGANMREPGRAKAYRAYLRMSHAEAAARLDRVTAPALVIMGTADPDFPDPVAEAHWIADRLHHSAQPTDVVLLEGQGHHPAVQRPAQVAEAILRFREAQGGA